MWIIERGKSYDLRVFGAIEIYILQTFLAVYLAISMIINIDLFLWLITTTKFTPETPMLNISILVAA